MLSWFIEWTTRLNQDQHLAFALVTVVVMAATGIGISLVTEGFFRLLGIRPDKEGRPQH